MFNVKSPTRFSINILFSENILKLAKMKYYFFMGDIVRENFISVHFKFNILYKYSLECFLVDLSSGKLLFRNIWIFCNIDR
jgi:hypothetical protein